MTTHKRRVVHYLVFILVGGVCVFLSYAYATLAAYISSNAPPSPSGTLFESIVLDQSHHDQVGALLLKEKGKLIPEGDFLNLDLGAWLRAGESSAHESVLCFATKTWALRVFFDDKGIAIAKELRW